MKISDYRHSHAGKEEAAFSFNTAHQACDESERVALAKWLCRLALYFCQPINSSGKGADCFHTMTNLFSK